jgi:hypothetical protein
MKLMQSIRMSSVIALCLAGCLSASDEHPGFSPLLRDKGAKISRIDDDMAMSQRLDLADGVMGPMVALHTGFANGAPVQYWDFGAAVATAEPVWRFRRHGAHGKVENVDHFDLVDSAPGDMSYSAMRVEYDVFVTEAWSGERITSMQALDDAIEIGLVEEPKRTKTFVNWPMTLAATKLAQTEGMPPLSPQPIYYRGKVASYFAPAGDALGVGSFEFMMEPISAPNAYVLRRQNASAPLDEGAQHMDLDGDGDMADSNVVFQVGAGEMGYASIWHQIDVIVAADYAFGSSTSEADLFERGEMGLGAAKKTVISYMDSGMLLNRILVPGGSP